MAWSRRADPGGEATTRAMHRPRNMVALGPQDLWAAGEGPNWALRLPGQSTQDSNRQKAAIRKKGVGSTGKAAHHHRRRRRIRQEQQGIQQTRSYDNWRQAALGVSVCSHRHQSKEVAVRGGATETESETETETASINSRKPLRAGNPSKSYLRIWAGNPESVVPGSALIRFCVQDSHSHNPLLGRKSRVSRAFYLGCWAGNRVSHPRFCAGQPE